MQKIGDSEAMNEIVNENVGLVWNIVKRFSNRGYEMDDLFQIGSIGLIKAVLRFDTNYNTKLSTYAVAMIIGEIKRFLRDDGIIKVSRSLKELAININDVRIKNTDKDYTIEELAEILEVEREDIVMALDACSSVNTPFASKDIFIIEYIPSRILIIVFTKSGESPKSVQSNSHPKLMSEIPIVEKGLKDMRPLHTFS